MVKLKKETLYPAPNFHNHFPPGRCLPCGKPLEIFFNAWLSARAPISTLEWSPCYPNGIR